MKLSKAQAEVMEQAKKDIDYARSHDFLHWISKAHGYDLDVDWDSHPNKHLTNARVLADAEEYVRKDTGWWRNRYEAERAGEVLTHCNSKTLAKLEQMGLVEIVFDSKGTSYGIDHVRVLNY